MTSLGQSRFLKSIRAVHRSGGLLVVKVYAKPDPTTSLKPYVKRLRGQRGFRPCSSRPDTPWNAAVEHDALQDVPNVLAYQLFIETEKAGYLLRQWGANNLYDRIRCCFSMCS